MIRLLLTLFLLLAVASAIACDGSASSGPCISNECLGGQSCGIANQWCCPNACICKYDICHSSSIVFLVTAQSIRVALSSPRTHILHGMLPFMCESLHRPSTGCSSNAFAPTPKYSMPQTWWPRDNSLCYPLPVQPPIRPFILSFSNLIHPDWQT
ncbi:hypothetical protein PMAYCL1PPCAC_26007 [Pristionchus mayeri]|uniref:Uncharacterized protein n=1 Tax=Pristionchus mayeri TaxID=1317129 RepID=A0AAN5I7U0_9BILA|nr:hypothetical protein PMAYCL1PPCAC_26007 [Pristionchus mayeri]